MKKPYISIAKVFFFKYSPYFEGFFEKSTVNRRTPTIVMSIAKMPM